LLSTLRSLAPAALAALAVLLPSPASAALLTDLTVFSTNADGHNYYSLIWNTQGDPDDRFNLYVSTSPDFASPTFINGYDDANTQIAVDLQPGTYYFTLFGESAFTPVPSDVHFVTNLYFGGNQSAPGISGLYGAACPTVCAAGHPNGMAIDGSSGHPEAGTLAWGDGSVNVTLTEFTWITNRTDIDKVWPYWANHLQYNNGSGTPDFFGTMRLEVTAVPEPGVMLLLLTGAAAAALRRARN
jgi:hypothetical protein